MVGAGGQPIGSTHFLFSVPKDMTSVRGVDELHDTYESQRSRRSSESRRHARPLPHESCAALNHAPLLIDGQLRIHGQCEHFPARLLAGREVSGAVAEMGQAALKMERHGIINLAADPFGLEMADQGIALAVGNADDILVEDMPALGLHPRAL